MREYEPYKWELLKFNDGKNTWYKVLGSWVGGYLDGDSWRLSSVVDKIDEDSDFYIMFNSSGSLYRCGKEGRGLTAYTSSIVSDILDQGEQQNIEVSIVDVSDFKGKVLNV